MGAHTHVGLEALEGDLAALLAHLIADHGVPQPALGASGEPVRAGALRVLHRSFSGQPVNGPLLAEPSAGPSTRWVVYPEHVAAFALIGGRLFSTPLRPTTDTDTVRGTHVRAMDLRDAFEVSGDERRHFGHVERDLFILWLREYQTEPQVSYIFEPETDEEADRAEEVALRALDDERGK